MTRSGLALAGSLAVLAALGASPHAAARELHWREFEVAARLASDGALHVEEMQLMVFTGDWNGGERKFRTRGGQTVEVERISRFDASRRAWIDLEQGDLDAVDRWDWHGSDTVRWRSRRPSDPPFDGTAILYRLSIVYRRILVPLGENRYRLSHDFAFAERDGPIEQLRVGLTLDPGWETVGPAPAAVEVADLPPGRGFVLERELVWRGEGVPAQASPRYLDRGPRNAAVALLLLAALERLVWFLRRDRALGRFERGIAPSTIDRAWLEARLLATPPELVGAAWDRSVGSAEVAALLARLVQEGKLASEVERRRILFFEMENLKLRLLVPRESLSAEERPVIDGLFPQGDTTDTAALRAHYRGRGFDPAAKLRKPLEKRLHAQAGFGSAPAKPSRWPTLVLFLAGLAALALGFLGSGAAGYGVLGAVLLVPLSIVGWIAAGTGQGRVGLPTASLVVLLLVLGAIGALLWGISGQPEVPLASLVGLALLGVAATRTFVHLVATRETVESMRRRRELAAARRYLREELRRSEPRLDDRWFPWVVAFGLAPEADRWFRAHGAAVAGRVGSPGGGSIGGGGGGGGWTGGGGAFGGAGATAAFASAVGSMAAGVSSGSSGSGGGGGGGSSGGGGGGGW
jgi:hypothetical protein